MIKYWYIHPKTKNVVEKEIDTSWANSVITGVLDGSKPYQCGEYKIPLDIPTYELQDVSDFPNHMKKMIDYLKDNVEAYHLPIKPGHFGNIRPFGHLDNIIINFSSEPNKAYIVAHKGNLFLK